MANLTTEDAADFFARGSLTMEATVTTYPLEAANRALAELRSGAITGAAVRLM